MSWWVHLFVIPALLVYAVFVLYPVILTLFNSFFAFEGLKRGAWIGFDNFTALFTTPPLDTRVWNALGNNIQIFVLSFALQCVVGFLVASLLYQYRGGREIFKAAYFLPRLLSLIVIGFLWQIIFSPNVGALNQFLEAAGLGALAQNWLGSPSTALYTVIFVEGWYRLGFSILVFLASMQAIPGAIFEAARLDGASRVRLLWYFMLPLTRPAWMILTVLTFIASFEMFDLVYAMQGVTGSPFYSSDTLGLLFYRLAFGGEGGTAAIGLGSALALMLIVGMALISGLMVFFFTRKRVEW
ncbi:sugar ABC transporter permease [Phytoactinopolyspora alkaliphila]|uniref:Sugar ABC transporter permease n=2 Tax=Phytoactinopolyspora alkaliphila TaxID=1783498 RepID=A0A6N9YFY2_9ACTN|nr:sugar ABC transporter permease [Phytoactinopolyspora alkaliphila]